MSRVLILAHDYGEAADIARLAGLRGSIGWDVFTVQTARFRRGNVVLSTGMHCWRGDRGFKEVHDIGNALVIGDFKTVPVPCPAAWRDTRFELPEGWAEPKVYEPKVVLYPPAPKKRSRWQRFLDRAFEPPEDHTW